MAKSFLRQQEGENGQTGEPEQLEQPIKVCLVHDKKPRAEIKRNERKKAENWKNFLALCRP